MRTSTALKALSAMVRHDMAQKAGEVWWEKHATAICDEAAAEAAAEPPEPKPAPTTPATPVVPVALQPTLVSPPPPRATPATAPPPSAPRKLTHPKLPKPLAALLESPTEKQPNTPREHVEEAVAAAFDAERAMRRWLETRQVRHGGHRWSLGLRLPRRLGAR